MKIKELFEELKNIAPTHGIYTGVIYYDELEINNGERFVTYAKKIKEDFKESTGLNIEIHIDRTDPEIAFDIEFPISKNAELDNIQEQLRNCLIFLNEPISDIEHYTIYDGIPNETIVNDYDVRLNCRNVVTLKDIDKIFINTPEIDLYNLNPIGILALLKCPKLKSVNTYHIANVNSKLNQICNIVNKYLPKGNVLKCQKELIQNGFKDYAK